MLQTLRKLSIYELSKTLLSITKIQKEWAYQHSFEHIGRRNSKGLISCRECGETFQGDGELIDNLLGAECPKCSTKLKVQTIRQRVFKQTEYFCIVTEKAGFQVLRFFLVKSYSKAGEKAKYSISEVVQRWIAPSGKYATVAKLRLMCVYYCDLWDISSRLEIRPERELYNISPICIYPRMKLIPEIKRSGFDGNFYRLSPFDLFHILLSDCRAETLLKARQTDLLRYFTNGNFSKIDAYWTSTKICIRNQYFVKDASLWRDYIDLLRAFGKDLHNAKYVCPADLKAEHDRYVMKQKELREREEKEQRKQKALEDEDTFKEMKSRFFGIHFTDGEIQVRVLESVEEFMQEGEKAEVIFANKIIENKAGTFDMRTCLQSFESCHAIEFLNRKYADIFPILTSHPQLENYLSPFMDAWEGGAADQLQGQIASAKIPLSRMISPQLYWVMTGNDFTLDINNPKEPKILCVGNNPDRQNIYSAALGLYNSRIVKLINKKGQLKSSVIIDELPTIYFRGLDNLIATARSNKVAVCLGFQDFSQLKRDYGDKEAAVVMNTVGNIFSGQVVGESAKNLSERFGKILQKRQSISINRQDTSTSISTQLDSLIPASKISNLTQGMFVGSVSDNFGERIEQKIFHAEIVVDNEKVAAETKAFQPIPIIADFADEAGKDIMQQVIEDNYNQIKADVKEIVALELKRISDDPELQHLIKKG